jgi:hypothetical protein
MTPSEKMLRELEWSYPVFESCQDIDGYPDSQVVETEGACPICIGVGEHRPECELKQALAATENSDTVEVDRERAEKVCQAASGSISSCEMSTEEWLTYLQRREEKE